MQEYKRRGKFFQQLMELLITELNMALKLGTPMILLALYRSEHVVQDVERNLESQLEKPVYQIRRLRVNKEQTNVINIISDLIDEKIISSVTYLDQGSGVDHADAYRVLNLHREFFIENNIPIIFWLTQEELKRLTMYAPDFWAFRHRVIDFTRIRATPKRSLWFEGFSWDETLANNDPNLTNLSTIRCEHGEVLRKQGQRYKAKKYLERCTRLFPDNAKVWNDLGNVFLDLGQTQMALVAYQKANILAPDQFEPLYNLGNLLLCMKNDKAAIKFLENAKLLAPEKNSIDLELEKTLTRLENMKKLEDRTNR